MFEKKDCSDTQISYVFEKKDCNDTQISYVFEKKDCSDIANLFLLTPLSSSIIAMIRRSACSRKKNTLRIEKLIKAENCSGLPFAITM